MKLTTIPALALAASMSGCIYNLPAPDLEHKMGSTTDVPVDLVTGHSGSFEIIKLKRWGDDSVEAALADARRKSGADADAITAVSAERRLICFPLCWFPLTRSVRTTATGALMRLGRDRTTTPSRERTIALEVGQGPSATALLSRLEHLHAESELAARAFYDSLQASARDELRDEVLSSRGVTSAQGRTFRPSKDAPAEQRRFLDWFVREFTTYSVVED